MQNEPDAKDAPPAEAQPRRFLSKHKAPGAATMKTFFLSLFLCAGLLTVGHPNDGGAKQGFLIDQSKHYVYLKFDRVGDREPLSSDEPDKGLWLRLVNNCRIPITVAIFNTENPEPDRGIAVYDEVVSAPAKGQLPILYFPAQPRNKPKPAAQAQEEPPLGYSLPDVFSTTTISPGDNLLFNLPMNHVGPLWYLQVRFYFALPGEGYGTGPYSVVSFDWQDIPEKFREPATLPLSPKPTTH